MMLLLLQMLLMLLIRMSALRRSANTSQECRPAAIQTSLAGEGGHIFSRFVPRGQFREDAEEARPRGSRPKGDEEEAQENSGKL